MIRAALALALALIASPAEARCRLALALALDVSGSVDMREYRLQLDGLNAALSDPEVRAAFFAMPEAPVSLAVYEWSSSNYQRLVLDWTSIGTPDDLSNVQARLSGWQRAPAPEATGLGAALVYGKRLLSSSPGCWAQTLDVSADGKNNDWPTPQRLRAGSRLDGMTVNGLVVATDFQRGEDRVAAGAAELSAYFHAFVIQGPGAFVEVALGYESYADAMRRKLLRELKVQPLGQMDGPAPRSVRSVDVADLIAPEALHATE